MDDIRLALRRLRRQLGATLASIAALACGIGAAAATWSLLSAVLLHPLPVAEPQRLVVVGQERETGDGGRYLRTGLLYTAYKDIERTVVFAGIAASGTRSHVVSDGSDAVFRSIDFVNGDFFAVLRVQPVVGRPLGPVDDRRGGPLVAVLSHRFWQGQFGADPAIVGRQMRVADLPVTVVGVAPARFRGLDLTGVADLFMPLESIGTLAASSNDLGNYYAEPGHVSSPVGWITVAGRLAPGVTPAEAAARLGDAVPLAGRDSVWFTIGATPAAVPERARADMAQFARLLSITVGLLLVIACLTVGMLLLTRTEARRGEFAMCRALGATRWRLARGVVVEGALLAAAGAALAAPVASWLFAGIRTFELPGRVAIEVLELSIDTGVLVTAAALAVGATLVIAVVAGAFGFSGSVVDVLRSRSGATPPLSRRGTRTVLVAGQIAVAVVLLAGTGLFVRSLSAALSLNPGYDTDRIVMGGVALAPLGYDTNRSVALGNALRERLDAVGALTSVSLMVGQGSMGPGGRVVVDGQDRRFPSELRYEAIDEQYFSTLGLRVIEGRDFTDADAVGSAPVTIVSQSFARLLADGRSPLGHDVRGTSRRAGQPFPEYEVVGVVPDIIDRVTTLEPLRMYFPLAQHPGARTLTVVFRPSGDVGAATREVTATLKALEPRILPPAYQTIDDRIRAQMAPQRFGMTVLGALGAIAALLTALGIYVVAESMAVARRREMGIRGALGASRRQLGALILSETGRLVGAGLAAGLALAWLGTGMIQAFLYRVEPLDPATLGAVSAGVLAIAIGVSLRPVVRTARVDLASVLREE